MFSYNLINKVKIDFDTKVIDNIFKLFYKTIKKTQKWTINIVFLDDFSIKLLNKKYRNIDKSTDVLSFHYYNNFDSLKNEEIAWEIIMSEEKIKIQAKQYKLWEEKEFYKLLIHSILHILWYDHEKNSDYKKMNNLEKKIWKEIFEK